MTDMINRITEQFLILVGFGGQSFQGKSGLLVMLFWMLFPLLTIVATVIWLRGRRYLFIIGCIVCAMFCLESAVVIDNAMRSYSKCEQLAASVTYQVDGQPKTIDSTTLVCSSRLIGSETWTK